MSKIVKSGKFLGRLIGPLLKAGSLMKNVLMPLQLLAAASATDPAIQKKVYWSGKRSQDLAHQTTFIISNKELDNTTKIVKSLF